MKNSVKAALAALAGGGLLLGGAGSLAYWSDTDDVPTTTVTSGTLDLAAPSCGVWKIDGGATFTPASDRIVPGDTLTRECTFALTVTGAHLEAEFTAATPTKDASALSDELVLSAAYEIDADTTNDGVGERAVAPEAPGSGTGTADITAADNGRYLRAIMTVSFPYGVLDNDSNGGIASILGAVTVTATQTNTGHL
jgi:alternate signal-mediated exported protein